MTFAEYIDRWIAKVCREQREALDQECWNILANAAIDDTMRMWGFAPEWYCSGCGAAMIGKSPWPRGERRCRKCGPGDNYAPCPATHREGAMCPLCKGVGYLEVI